MENPPFEDVFPIQDGDFPLLCLFTGRLLRGYLFTFSQVIGFTQFYSQKLLKDPGRKFDKNRRLLLLESLNILGELCVFPFV